MTGTPLGYAASLIKRRLRSAWEIDQALLKRGVSEDERVQVITKLNESGLLNDARYALAWMHTRDRLSPRGEWLLIQELKQRGVGEADIQKALKIRKEENKEENGESEWDRARRVAEIRERQYVGLPRDTRKRRLAAYLTRRGFSSDTVRRILDA